MILNIDRIPYFIFPELLKCHLIIFFMSTCFRLTMHRISNNKVVERSLWLRGEK